MREVKYILFVLSLIAGFVSADLLTSKRIEVSKLFAQDTTPPTPSPEQPVSTTVKATIKGPTEVLAGTLLFLSAEDATGDNFKWLIPDKLKESSASCGPSIFFAIPTPGEYEFGLVAVNKKAEIDVAYHKVRVKSGLGPIPPPEEPEQPPTTPVPGSYEKLIQVSKQGITAVNDPNIAASLKALFQDIIKNAGNKTLNQLIDQTALETGNLLGSRSRTEWKEKNWGELWVKPVDTAITELAPKDSRQYLEILNVLVGTL